jgi:amidase
MPFQTWQQTAASKRATINSLLPAPWKLDQSTLSSLKYKDVTQIPESYLSVREIEITEKYTATDLVAMLSSGALTAVEVTEAFCHRATIAHQLVSPMLRHVICP